MDIDRETYERFAELIHSDASPVGIDAKKTHILILAQLERLEVLGREILSRLEEPGS